MWVSRLSQSSTESEKRAHQPSRRRVNEEEYTTRMNVSKKPKLTSKGANPKAETDPKI
jgi:hypothetical protein